MDLGHLLQNRPCRLYVMPQLYLFVSIPHAAVTLLQSGAGADCSWLHQIIIALVVSWL